MTHAAGVIIGRGAKIGANVHILPGVLIGGSAKGWFDPTFVDGYPEIGDDTALMAGAKILGPIHVGKSCFVGANAVLSHDLADEQAYTPGRELKALRNRVDELSDGSQSKSPEAPEVDGLGRGGVGMIRQRPRSDSRAARRSQRTRMTARAVLGRSRRIASN